MYLQLNNFEIKPGKFLKVNASVANVRLFVGNIPKNRTRDEIFEEFQKSTGKSSKHCMVQLYTGRKVGLSCTLADAK